MFYRQTGGTPTGHKTHTHTHTHTLKTHTKNTRKNTYIRITS